MRRKGESEPGTRLALAWYRRDQWDMLMEHSADARDIDGTYDEWLATNLRLERQMRAMGAEVVRVDMDIPIVLEWCRRKGLPLNGESRSEYAIRHAPGADEADK